MDTVFTPIHSYPTGNSYTVTLYTSNLPCIDSTTTTITLSHPLIASFTSSPGDTLCQGTVINFTNTSTGAVSSYLWNLGDGTTTVSDQNPPPHIYNTTGVYTVSLVINDTIPCYDTAKAMIYVDSNSAVSFKLSDSSICAGQQVIFTANYTRIGGQGISWNFGDGFTAGNTNPVSHTYTNNLDSAVVTLSAAYRVCPDTTAKETVYIHPYPMVNLGPDTALCPGGTPIALNDYINAGTPGTRWVWNTGDTTSGITVTVPDVYYVTVTQAGCSNSDSVWVKRDCYIDIPNVFTPNGDGLNDYFFPRELLTSGATKFSMEVYNRWGQQIFSTNSTEGEGWDGKFNGVDQPEGVYVYIIDVSFKNGKTEHHQGNVTLLK
jgi:gliding motility-associated-like protein